MFLLDAEKIKCESKVRTESWEKDCKRKRNEKFSDRRCYKKKTKYSGRYRRTTEEMWKDLKEKANQYKYREDESKEKQSGVKRKKCEERKHAEEEKMRLLVAKRIIFCVPFFISKYNLQMILNI